MDNSPYETLIQTLKLALAEVEAGRKDPDDARPASDGERASNSTDSGPDRPDRPIASDPVR
jgi:hypothetical protein